MRIFTRKMLIPTAALVASISTLTTAQAATLEVGPGKTYSKPCDAIAKAQPNDTVEVSPGTYTDTCAIKVAGLTLRGVGGMPKIDLSNGTPAGQKGIYNIDADGITIENLELMGSHIDPGAGENGAAIRIEATNLTIRGCYIHDNQDGILGFPPQLGGTLLIESTEFAGNGLGNGCNGSGCTHNVYIGENFDKVTFQYNWSHKIANDTPDKGHLLKSRAHANYILYNRITAEGDTDSYEIDLPQGGLAVVVGNMIEKSPTAGNPTMLAWGEEGVKNPDKRVFIVNNTFVNDFGKGTFINIAAGGMLTAHNNLLVGAGTPSNTGALSADNLSGVMPMLVDAAGFDYHLQMGSPAIDKGVDPGSADAFSLKPTEEYVHPLKHTARKDDGKLDVGAFEFGTVQSGSGGGSSASSGSASGSGGASGSGSGTLDGSSAASGGGGEGGGGSSGDKGGCGCRLAGDDAGMGMAAPVAAMAMIGLMRRRRRARGRATRG